VWGCNGFRLRGTVDAWDVSAGRLPSGDTTPCRMTGVTVQDTPPCRMTGVTLHGAVSPEGGVPAAGAGRGAWALSVKNASCAQKRNLIAVSICDRYSVGPSIRPMCTRYCFTMTNMIQVCSNFH